MIKLCNGTKILLQENVGISSAIYSRDFRELQTVSHSIIL